MTDDHRCFAFINSRIAASSRGEFAERVPFGIRFWVSELKMPIYEGHVISVASGAAALLFHFQGITTNHSPVLIYDGISFEVNLGVLL